MDERWQRICWFATEVSANGRTEAVRITSSIFQTFLMTSFAGRLGKRGETRRLEQIDATPESRGARPAPEPLSLPVRQPETIVPNSGLGNDSLCYSRFGGNLLRGHFTHGLLGGLGRRGGLLCRFGSLCDFHCLGRFAAGFCLHDRNLSMTLRHLDALI